MIVLIKGIIWPCQLLHNVTCIISLKLCNMIRVESDLLEAYRPRVTTDHSYEVSYHDKKNFHAPSGLAALLRGDTETIMLLEKIGE